MTLEFHCGCCGRLIEPGSMRVPEPIWCHRCPGHLLSHTAEDGTVRRIEERTFSAQHDGAPCPHTDKPFTQRDFDRLHLELR